MSLRVKTERRSFGFDKTKTEKYVATAQRGATVEFTKVVEQVSLRCGLPKATCRAVIDTMVEAASTWMLEGHGVSIGEMGYLKPAITCKASETKGGEKITRKRVLFLPSKSFKAVIDSMKVTQAGTDTVEDDEDRNPPTSGGNENSGGDTGEFE